MSPVSRESVLRCAACGHEPSMRSTSCPMCGTTNGLRRVRVRVDRRREGPITGRAQEIRGGFSPYGLSPFYPMALTPGAPAPFLPPGGLRPMLRDEDEDDDDEDDNAGHGPALVEERGVVRLSDVKGAPKVLVRSSGDEDLDRVLSAVGGFVRPFAYIFAGEPGSGKSRTLRRALIAMIEADPDFRAMYGATEESADEIFGSLRMAGLIHRGNEAAVQERLLVCEGRSVERLVGEADANEVDFLVGDSINEYLSEREKGGRGDARQLLAVAYAMRAWAHRRKATSALVAQVNKDLDVAGAKALEHAVDGMIMHEIISTTNGTQVQFTPKRRIFTKGKHRRNKSGVEAFFWMTEHSIEPFDAEVHGAVKVPAADRVVRRVRFRGTGDGR